MSKGISIIGIIMLGIFTLAIIHVINNFQTGNELDYYLLRETTEEAMIDAVDVAYYKVSGGVVRMDREKFLESFVRRFSENVNADRDYHIKIIDVNETPPKASIQVESYTVATFTGDSAGMINKIDAIIETKYDEDRLLRDVNE